MIGRIRSYFFLSLKEAVDLLVSRFSNSDRNVFLNYSRILVEELLREKCHLTRFKSKFLVSQYKGLNIYVRKRASDSRVFQQVFILEEYKPLVDFILNRGITVENIVDCGANVGYASLFLSKFFPKAMIVCIEPDSGNMEMIKQNISVNKLNQVKLLQKGVWHREAFLKINTNFRDGSNWALSLEETESIEEADTEGISITNIIKQYNLSEIDLLKIDIEGAERYLFQDFDTANTFLSKTKCLAIEIHDEFGIRNKIKDILTNARFELFEAGEFTIAYKAI